MKKKSNWIVFSLILLCSAVGGSLSAEVIDRIVAIVDNDIVTLVQLRKETAPYQSKMEASGYSDEKKKKMLQDLDKNVLKALIDQSLTQQEARKYNITVSNTEINNAVENVKKSKSLTDKEFESVLENEGLTLEGYRENIKKQILQSRLINHAVKSKVVIMESDIQKEYEANTEKYSGKKKYHLRNILMTDENEIKAVKKELDNGKEFTGLAKKFSIASNASDGGDLGIFDISNFSQNIKESLSKLKIGQYSNVISTAQGFQIFYIDDIVLEGAKTLAQAHDEIHEKLYREQVEKKFETWLESLKKKAHIKIML